MNKRFFKRVVKFVKSYVLHDPLFVLAYALVFFYPGFIFRPKFYSNRTIQDKLAEGRSLLRLGDGEIHIMNGGSIGFQKYEKEIAYALKKSIVEYSDSSPYILCINERVMDKPNSYLRKVNQLYLWLPTKVYYWLYFNKRATYFDASAFYYKHSFDKILTSYLSNKKIILVTRKETAENFQKNYRSPSNIKEIIITKSEDSFDEQAVLIEKLSKYEDQSQDIVVLLSCGPTGKYIAYKLSSKIQCLDIGHGLEIAYTENDLERMLVI